MSTTANLPGLLDVAGRAIEVSDAGRLRKLCKGALDDAYRAWKRENGVGHVDRDTPDWQRMMDDTAPAYERLKKAKGAERNALRRLATAVKRFKEGVEA